MPAFASINGCNDDDDSNTPSVGQVVVNDGNDSKPAIADFTAPSTEGRAPLTVEFTNLSENADSFVWKFGDGTQSTEPEPTHTYGDRGIYTVTLTAVGAEDAADTKTRTAYIRVQGIITRTIHLDEDAYVRNTRPDKTYNDIQLQVRSRSDDIWYSYVGFELPSDIPVESLDSVTLVFEGALAAGSTFPFTVLVNPIEEEWAEETVTWNTRPEHLTPTVERIVAEPGDFTLDVDVTEIVQHRQWLAKEMDQTSLCLRPPNVHATQLLLHATDSGRGGKLLINYWD